MKRTWILAAGMLVLSGAIYVSSQLMAQPGTTPPARPAAAPQTHIGLVNLSAVIKGYKKYQTFQDEIKGIIKKYQDIDKKIREEITKAKGAIDDPKTLPEHREQWAKNLRIYERQIEDNNTEAKTVLGKKSDEQMVILYKEVHDMAKTYAGSAGLELVLHYNDADDKSPEFYSPANVARKMQAGACMPMHIAPGMEISNQLIELLNRQYAQSNPAAAGAAHTTTTTPKP